MRDPVLLHRLAALKAVRSANAAHAAIASCAAYAAAYEQDDPDLAAALRGLSAAFDGGNIVHNVPTQLQEPGGTPADRASLMMSCGPGASPSPSPSPSPSRDPSPSRIAGSDAGPGPGSLGHARWGAGTGAGYTVWGSGGAGTSQPSPHFYPVGVGFPRALEPKDLTEPVRTFGLLDKRSNLDSRIPYSRERASFKAWCTSPTELTRPPEMQALAATSWRSMEGAVSLFLGYCHVHLHVPPEFLGLTLFSNQVCKAWARCE